MSGVHLLVDCLHQQTGIRCISREDLEEIVNRQGRLASRIMDKLTHATAAYDQFSELRWPYLVLMREAMLEAIRTDQVLYHGYSAHLLLPMLQHFVRIRIAAPLKLRVPMTMERLQCDEEAARRYITEADAYRVKWARFMYGRDIRDTLLYDFTINLEHVTFQAACGMIRCLMEEQDFQSTPESAAELERLYRAAQIEVALVTDPRTQAFEISARVQDGKVRLCGPYLEDAERSAAEQVARTVEGVESVTYEPGFASTLGVGV